LVKSSNLQPGKMSSSIGIEDVDDIIADLDQAMV